MSRHALRFGWRCDYRCSLSMAKSTTETGIAGAPHPRRCRTVPAIPSRLSDIFANVQRHEDGHGHRFQQLSPQHGNCTCHNGPQLERSASETRSSALTRLTASSRGDADRSLRHKPRMCSIMYVDRCSVNGSPKASTEPVAGERRDRPQRAYSMLRGNGRGMSPPCRSAAGHDRPRSTAQVSTGKIREADPRTPRVRKGRREIGKRLQFSP